MVRKNDERFPKRNRLKKRPEFVHVQETGKKLHSELFIGMVVTGQVESPTRMGITTTRRYNGATIRNWTRRLVREAFRRGVLALPKGVDIVVIPKKAVPQKNSATIFRDLAALGDKITRYVDKVRQ